jgi:cell division protein FtsB
MLDLPIIYRKNDELTAKNNQLEKHVKDLKEKNTQ